MDAEPTHTKKQQTGKRDKVLCHRILSNFPVWNVQTVVVTLSGSKFLTEESVTTTEKKKSSLDIYN